MANPAPKIINLNFSYLIVSVRRSYHTCASFFFFRFFFRVNVCLRTFFSTPCRSLSSPLSVPLSPCLCVPFSPSLPVHVGYVQWVGVVCVAVCGCV